MRNTRVIAIAACCMTVALLGAACGEDGTTATTAVEQTDTTTSTTTTAGSVEGATSAPGIWPPDGGDVAYSDPVDAATSFATELVGFTDPIVGEYLEGDARSGEVEVRSRDDGPITVVFVRQLQGDAWSVIGAATADIALESPGTLDTITSPVALAGRATAFEGTVQTAVTDADGERLGEGFVTGGALGELQPFDGDLAFEAPSGDHGAVLAYTVSARDGSVEQATATAVRFTDDG